MVYLVGLQSISDRGNEKGGSQQEFFFKIKIYYIFKVKANTITVACASRELVYYTKLDAALKKM